MYLRARELLTPEQRKDFLSFPSKLSDWELAYYYTLSLEDMEIIKRRRRDHNRLGFAIQLCLFRYPGWPLPDIKQIPDSLIGYVAKQLTINPSEFKLYSDREQTRHEHMEEIRRHFGFSNFTANTYRVISQTIFPHALENGNAIYLIRLTLEELRKRKIILPAMTTIERLVWETRRRAEEKSLQFDL